MTEESLFLAALERTDPAERQAFLEQACAGDAELRQRIGRLLTAYAAGQDKLEPPAPAPAPTVDYHPTAGPGDVIAGRYKLLERIGEGGMGEVWVAKQTEPVHRKVALKLIKPGMDSKAVLARFEQERQALALMDHPHIARVFDGGLSADGRPFFVMELVNGLPLTKFCDDAKLTPRERLELFVPVCQAVQHAHQKGIVHRDLKPSNVLVTLYDGKPVPKVIDFGLAKAIGGKLTDASLSTQFGSVVGTLEYMAPEQAGFSALDVDTRADVYALGVILYELLTGLRPFDSQRLRKAAVDEAVRIIREEEPPRPSLRLSSDQSLPSLAALRQTEPKRLMALMRGELDWVVMKCLEKERNRRYETANGLARDIQRYLHDDPVEARPPSAGYKVRKFLRRHKGPALAAGAMAVLLVLGSAVSTWQAVRATRAEGVAEERREEAVQAEQQAKDERDRAETSEAKAQHSLYIANMNRVLFELEHNNVDQARELLDLYRHPTAPENDQRGWEWFYWDRMCHGELSTVPAHSGDVRKVEFSPDGSLIVSCGDSTIKLWDTVTGKPSRTPLSHAFVHTVAFSSDGRTLVSCGNDVKMWDVASWKELRTLQPEGTARFMRMAYSPDGKILAVADSGSASIKVWDLKEEKWLGSLPGASTIDALCFSPDGKVLAIGRNDGVHLWNVARLTHLRILQGHKFMPRDATLQHEGITALAFSPDSRTLATSSKDGTAKLYDVNSGKDIRTLTVLPAGGTLPVVSFGSGLAALTFSPDGQYLITAGAHGSLKSWQVSTGREVSSFLGHRSGVQCVAISPDGMRLASGDRLGEFKIWDTTVGPTQIPSLGPITGSHAQTFSPDGNLLAVRFGLRTPSGRVALALAPSGRVDIRNLAQISRTIILDHKPYGVSAMTFSPDSKTLAVACSLYDRNPLQMTACEIRFWDLASRRVVRSIPGFKSDIYQLAFSPDATLLAVTVGTDYDPALQKWRHQEAKLWDLMTGKERRSPLGTSIAFSPDGRTLAVVGNDQILKLMDWIHGQELHALKCQGSPGEVSFSRDGTRLFFDGAVWDVASGREICWLKGNDGVTSFSADSKRLFSISAIRRLFRVWDGTTGEMLLAAQVPGGGGLAVHPDGWRCAVASGETGIWFVDARPLTQELREQCQAQGVVAHLFRRRILKEDVLPDIRDMKTISEPVRHQALAMTQQLENDVLLINLACTDVLLASDRTPEEYQRALRWAEEGQRLAPEEGFIVQNVGGALYRVGRYQEAAAMCERTYEMNLKQGAVGRPTQHDLLFLAMAQYKLGRHEDARCTFKRLKPGVIKPDLWREAEALIEGKPNEPNK
jgi:WD40 repeat protein